MEEQADYITEANEMIGKGYDEPQEIKDDSDLRKYRIELPNLYDDADLDPYEFRLLAHYKRVGTCTEGSGTTSLKCKMSPSQVSKVRKNLHRMGFIKMSKATLGNRQYTYIIVVVDKWKENFEKYSALSQNKHTPSPHEAPPSRGDTPPSPHEATPHHNAIKNKPIKNKPIKKEEGASAPTPDAVRLFREVTTRYPSRDTYPIVVEAMEKIRIRLGMDVTAADLLPFWRAWRIKAYKPTNLTWLTEWAVEGTIPSQGKQKSSNYENNMGMLHKWLEGAPNGGQD